MACTPVSPQNPLTSIAPLVLVMTFQACKDAVEDYKRHKCDDETNGSKAKALRGTAFVSVRWDELVVGDIVELEESETVPADVVRNVTVGADD